MFERVLVIGADFNSVDSDRRVRASLRYGRTSEIPAVGERVLLEDGEGNTCIAVVEGADGLALLARPDWSTWVAGDVAAIGRVFASPHFVAQRSVESPTDVVGTQYELA